MKNIQHVTTPNELGKREQNSLIMPSDIERPAEPLPKSTPVTNNTTQQNRNNQS